MTEKQIQGEAEKHYPKSDMQRAYPMNPEFFNDDNSMKREAFVEGVKWCLGRELQENLRNPEFMKAIAIMANEDQRKLLDSVKTAPSGSEIHTDWGERHTDWQEDMSGHTVDTDAISQKIADNYGGVIKKLKEE